MTTLTINISEREREDLKERAERLGLQLEELATLSLRALLFQDGPEFSRALEYLLRKNEELYRRLA